MKEDKIQLLNSQNQPVYQKYIKQAANNNDISVYDGAEDEIISPDVRTTKTKLSMKD